MRFIILVLALFPLFTNAQNVKTEHFLIQLPDELKVQNDNLRRILAFGPNQMPFVSIEYGTGIAEQFERISEEINQKLVEFDSELVQGECGVGCISMTGAAVANTDEDDIYLYYYLAKSKTINFVISVASTTQIEGGELDVINIAKQMLSGK
ncbi:hypothetical protein NQT65_01655 [Pseudoalteromonas agarivorans]|uniref:hypothetical protein n=1 Tax=Pseudoalteromonas agarivorans TaxID=176102 RepID=UPI0021183AFE|nr:hypothetical protein [Pseudoalteromonas agarivorans]MCQ8818914.1 hypothetical protein [Pseudoalteromonas agarivorans]